ncbi:XK-related protein 2 [Sardina pilchardus]|uniref:XK-related protein 2 n=1 Tax=Sardina pilchardus TaxID=27697 RepID=UPI002E1137FF
MTSSSSHISGTPYSRLMERKDTVADNEIVEVQPQQHPHPALKPENGDVVLVINHSQVHPPISVILATVLWCAEIVCASVLCKRYHTTDDDIWMGLTIAFMLVPAVLIQLTLTFIHRDLGMDRPLVLFMHMLMLGPLIRCIEAVVTYCRAGRQEEPYVTISRKMKLKKGKGLPMEWEIGHSERRLAVHRNAFKRTAIIQAFLGSTPQLTLQLYATIQEKYVFLYPRLVLMIITLISITYGALVCSVLAINIKYDEYKVRVRAPAYLCMVLWRGLEIATRVVSLVLFCTALNVWIVPVGLANLLFFFFLPWVEFWARRGSLPENVEKDLSKVGTVVVLSMVTLLYACINVFCWSAVQLNLADHDLIEKKPRWNRVALYYAARFAENVLLTVLWYLYKSDFYEYVCAPLLVVQLVVCYGLAVFFMLLFYQFCHPCRRLFHHNVEDFLRCFCCRRSEPRAEDEEGQRREPSSAKDDEEASPQPLLVKDEEEASPQPLLVKDEEEASPQPLLEPPKEYPPELTVQLPPEEEPPANAHTDQMGDRETDIVDDLVDSADHNSVTVET